MIKYTGMMRKIATFRVIGRNLCENRNFGIGMQHGCFHFATKTKHWSFMQRFQGMKRMDSECRHYSTNNYPHTYSDLVVFDLETSGLNKTEDKILEIAAIKLTHGAVTGSFSTLVRQDDVVIAPHIQEITSINQQMMMRGMKQKDALDAFLSFCRGGTFLCAHNASGDVRFLQEACLEENIEFPYTKDNILCTLLLSRRLLDSKKIKSRKLGDLCKSLGITNQLGQYHRAMPDTNVTCKLWKYLYDGVAKRLEFSPSIEFFLEVQGMKKDQVPSFMQTYGRRGADSLKSRD